MDADRERLTGLIARFISFSSKYLPDDVTAKLEELRRAESSPRARAIYDAVFRNLELAAELDRPLCQDTGLIQFFVKAGTSFPLLDQLEGILREAVIRATVHAPLRPNAVAFFDEKNSGDNTGRFTPWIDWEPVPGEGLKLYVYLAGGGCSLPGFSRVLTPLEGWNAALEAVFERVSTLAVNACPPLLIGIGLGSSADTAAKLSKKALLRFIGERNPRLPELEKEIEEGLNRIGIGPSGLTGNASVMAVHIEEAVRHPATFALGLSVGCWAHRRALIEISAGLDYRLLSHKGKTL
ncbi:MAG: L(+)-tartrate dehydratase subunit alpha [Treponema sp.]|jgi:L(+)-tartrate dehydratase alpha subunit|nr:L(+)-tartrate dehydratase subunit alpha [Treponema sp.]